MPGPENRQDPRLPHGTEVQVENEGEFVEKFSGNVSRGGIFVKTPRPLPVGREVVLKIALAGGGYLEAEGTVTWSRIDEDPQTGEPPGMGIKFKQIGPGIEVLLDRVVTAGESRIAGGGPEGIRCLLFQLRRNRKGETVREGRLLTGQTLAIGRASAKDIWLPDPRVALDHAVIKALSSGSLTVESAGPELLVNGAFCRSADLDVGLQFDIGPYHLVVETQGAEGYPEHDLALSLERVEAAPEAAPRRRRKARPVATTLSGTRLSKRLFSLLAIALVGIFFLVLPTLQAASPSANLRLQGAGWNPATLWNPGPLSSGHRSLLVDCPCCHAAPFVAVQDQQCRNCHSNVGDHLREAGAAQNAGETGCTSCHREHHGSRSMADHDPQLCVNCHGVLHSTHPESKLPDITGFSTDHPAFRLQGPEPSGLRFAHDTHLAASGVRSPDAAPGSKGLVVMQCTDCHELDAGRHFYQPVSMEKHCAGCHRLDFEPGLTSRQVPHGSVTAVLTTLREFYSGVALGTTPMGPSAGTRSLLFRPGGRSEARAPGVQPTAGWALDHAQSAATDLFEKRACHDCHLIERVRADREDPAGIRGASWRVQPVVQANRRLPGSAFEHSRHATQKCEVCHSPASKKSGGMLLPTVEVCRGCHVSKHTPDKVTSGCEYCHGYHSHPSDGLAAAAESDGIP